MQNLTEKLYTEGVEKGKAEAAALIRQAQTEADEIVSQAKKEAETLRADAQKAANDLTNRTQAELKLYFQQALNALKGDVVNLINGKIVENSVKAATTDPKFMQQVITNLCEQWAKAGDVTIETADAQALTEYFAANAKHLLNGGVEVKSGKNHANSFTISPADGGYKVKFGEEELIAFFKDFLRPQLVEQLF